MAPSEGKGSFSCHLPKRVHLAAMPNDQTHMWNYTSTYQDPLRTNTTHLASGVVIQTDAPTDNTDWEKPSRPPIYSAHPWPHAS